VLTIVLDTSPVSADLAFPTLLLQAFCFQPIFVCSSVNFAV
jgi:hypothetical protein